MEQPLRRDGDVGWRLVDRGRLPTPRRRRSLRGPTPPPAGSEVRRARHRPSRLFPWVVALSLACDPRSTIAGRGPGGHATAADTFEVGMLRVERTGPRGRPPIILIPALFCGSWEWEREITLLGADHEVFAVTLPGFDGRPRDEGGDLMARAAGDLDALIRTHHLDHPLLVGHSLGGTLAVLFAESYPNSAGDIVTVEGGLPIAPTPAARAARIRAATAPYRTIPDSLFGPVLRDNMLKYVITRPEDVDRVTPLAARSDRIAVIRWMEAALSLDLSPGMGSITVPLTAIIPYDSLIDGYQGYATEAAKRATYAAWLAPARRGGVVMIPHARHFVMIDRPEAFDLALLAAIAPTGPPPR